MSTRTILFIIAVVAAFTGLGGVSLTYAQGTLIVPFIKGGRIINKIPKHLPPSKIEALAQIAKGQNGGKMLGQEVGKLGLTEVQRADTFLQVAVRNGILTAKHEEDIRKMGNIKGLASLLSKVNNPSVNAAKGHIQELEIGIGCTNRGGKVLAFGEKFKDGIKHGETDLDVLVEMNGKRFAVESKNYQDAVPMDMIRADSQSLLAYCKTQDKTAQPIFAIRNTLSDNNRQLLEKQYPDIQYLTGTPEEICTKLDVLAR
jgi:hypothetical protein